MAGGHLRGRRGTGGPCTQPDPAFCLLLKLASQVFNFNNFSSVFTTFCRYINHIFCHNFD